MAVGVDAQQVEEEDVLILLQNVLQAGIGPGRLEKRLEEHYLFLKKSLKVHVTFDNKVICLILCVFIVRYNNISLAIYYTMSFCTLFSTILSLISVLAVLLPAAVASQFPSPCLLHKDVSISIASYLSTGRWRLP